MSRTDRRTRLAVLVSGRGSNLEAVLDAVVDGRLPLIEPVLVVSNRPSARAVSVAVAHGVATRVMRRADHADAAARDSAMGALLARARVDLALLAGYDQLLRPGFFTAYRGRIMNIHPSLLPRHGGQGMIGLAVHAAVLAAGDVETGASVHWVTPELDAGPVIAQRRTAVLPGESVQELAERVLVLEHALVIEVLAALSAEIAVDGASGSMTAASRAPERSAAAQQRSQPHA